MLFNNVPKKGFGPSGWIDPVGPIPFMRGDYVPVYRMTSRSKDKPLGSVSYGVPFSGWLGDWLKKKKDEKIAECKADPDACAAKIIELERAYRDEDCSKYRLNWRKKKCQERKSQYLEDINLIKSLSPAALTIAPVLLPGTVKPSTVPSPIPSVVPLMPQGMDYDRKNIALVAGGVAVVGLIAYFVLRK